MPFGGMINAIFGNPHFSTPATYAPLVGSPVAVTVLRRSVSGDRQQDFGGLETGAYLPGDIADIRVSDLVEPQEGASLVIGSEVFIIRGYRRDSERLVWRLDLDKQ